MKLIKIFFLISLFNLLIIGAIVLAFKGDKGTISKPRPIFNDIVPTTVTTKVLTVPTVDSRCVITIDGVKYDISQYQYQHSGGNIFQCGTDMSTVFHNRHSNRFLQYMEQFRI